MNGVSDTEEKMNAWLEDTIEIRRTAVNMVHLHNEGIPFLIVRPKDLLVIYEKWNTHLNRWKERLESPFGCRKPPPVQDFIMIENFLRSITEVAEAVARRRHFTEDMKQQPGEVQFWDYISSLGNNFGFGERIQVPAYDPNVRYSESPVRMQKAWENSTWGKMAAEAHKRSLEY
jgi:hypothetical protein